MDSCLPDMADFLLAFGKVLVYLIMLPELLVTYPKYFHFLLLMGLFFIFSIRLLFYEKKSLSSYIIHIWYHYAWCQEEER